MLFVKLSIIDPSLSLERMQKLRGRLGRRLEVNLQVVAGVSSYFTLLLLGISTPLGRQQTPQAALIVPLVPLHPRRSLPISIIELGN